SSTYSLKAKASLSRIFTLGRNDRCSTVLITLYNWEVATDNGSSDLVLSDRIKNRSRSTTFFANPYQISSYIVNMGGALVVTQLSLDGSNSQPEDGTNWFCKCAYATDEVVSIVTVRSRGQGQDAAPQCTGAEPKSQHACINSGQLPDFFGTPFDGTAGSLG
ncbi:hypothetical protein BDFB_011574, partial [Asbolus verrucosus]